VTAPVRVAALSVAVGFLLVAAAVTAVGVDPAGTVAIWALAMLVVLCVWRWYLVPYVALTPDRLVVQGVFSHWAVRYGAINDARPGLLGIRVDTVDQGAFTAWAVQKSTLSGWLHRRTRADEVAGAIMARVREVGTPAS